MYTVLTFIKFLTPLMRNDFRKRPSGAPLHTLTKSYHIPIGFVNLFPSFEAVSCFICGRRRVVVAWHRMICLVLIFYEAETNFQKFLDPPITDCDVFDHPSLHISHIHLSSNSHVNHTIFNFVFGIYFLFKSTFHWQIYV